MHRSISTIASPEFINLQPLDINPLMSKCEIKVLYVGENRNRSYISKEVATEMAKTLRGAPIVGYYKENKEDFADHGEQLILDDEGFHFNCLTKPYGFVSPDADVWFKEFEDTDDFGNTVTREYLMTTGYLWTTQFEEASKVVDGEGKNQSMELDNNTLQGHFATNNNTGIEYFIIDDAIFSKLCILGDDVEPCFEGASISKPQISTSFSKSVDDKFKQDLFSMMQDLKFALKGGQTTTMELEDKEVTTPAVEETVVDNAAAEVKPENTEVVEENLNSTESTPTNDSEFAKNDDKEKNNEEDKNKDNKDEKDDSEDDEDKKKYSKLEQEHEELKIKFAKLEEDYNTLVEFKKNVEDKEKDELIAKFYMLSDEDKKDVVENKSKYSKEEIEAKLSVICFRNKVNFDLDDSTKNDSKKEDVVTTFSLSNEQESSLPAWLKAVKDTQTSREEA